MISNSLEILNFDQLNALRLVGRLHEKHLNSRMLGAREHSLETIRQNPSVSKSQPVMYMSLIFRFVFVNLKYIPSYTLK